MSGSLRDEVSVRREIVAIKLKEAIAEKDRMLIEYRNRLQGAQNESQTNSLTSSIDVASGYLKGLEAARAIVDAWL